MEIDDKMACRIHGIISSDSDSDSDSNCKSDFDEEYEAMRPPPLDYESIKHKIVLCSPKQTEAASDFTVVISKKKKRKLRAKFETMEKETKPESVEMETKVSKQPPIDNETFEDDVVVKEDSETVCDAVAVATKKKKKKKSKSKRKAENIAEKQGPSNLNNQKTEDDEEDLLEMFGKKNEDKSFLGRTWTYLEDLDHHIQEKRLEVPKESMEKFAYIARLVRQGIHEMNHVLDVSQHVLQSKGLCNFEIEDAPPSPKKKAKKKKKKKSKQTQIDITATRAVTEKQLNLTHLNEEISNRAWTLPKIVEASNEPQTEIELSLEDLNDSETATIKTTKTMKKKPKQYTENELTSSDTLQENQKTSLEPLETPQKLTYETNNKTLCTTIDILRNSTPVRTNSVGFVLRPMPIRTNRKLIFDVNRKISRLVSRVCLEPIERGHGFGRWGTFDNTIQDFMRTFDRLVGHSFIPDSLRLRRSVFEGVYDTLSNSESVSNGSVSNDKTRGVLCCVKNSKNASSARCNRIKRNQRFLVPTKLLEVGFIIFLAKIVVIVLKEIIAFLCRNAICVCLVFSAFLTIYKLKSRKT